MLLRSLLLAAVAAWGWSADATPDVPAQGAAAAAPAAKPLPDSVEPELAKQAFKAMDAMRAAIESAHKAGEDILNRDKSLPRPYSDQAGAASKQFREYQRQCLVEFFSVPERRHPLPELMGKDATDFNESIDGDWENARSTLPQRAGYAYGHAKKIEWLQELCDGAPHRYGNKNRDELDAERKARENAPAPKPKKKP